MVTDVIVFLQRGHSAVKTTNGADVALLKLSFITKLTPLLIDFFQFNPNKDQIKKLKLKLKILIYLIPFLKFFPK